MSTARVVHIIDHFGLGGVQTFLRTVLPLLPRDRFGVRVINLRHETVLSKALESDGIPIISLDLPRWSPRQYLKLIILLRALQPHIVHTHLTVGKLLGRIAAVHCGAPGIILDDQLSISQDIYTLPPLIILAYRLLESWLEPYTDLYISPSLVVQETSWIAKRWSAEKCRVLNNAIDATRFAPAADRAQCRAALDLPERPTIATFGRMVPQKCLGDVIRVAERVVQRSTNVQFLIAGEGPLEEALREQIYSAGLSDHVFLLGFRRDTEQILAAADVYLSTSAGEAFSVAILEAMASACAVVATTAGGTTEQVFPGVNGYLARVGDIEGLTNAVLCLLEQPERRHTFGLAGRRYVLDHFTAPIVADRLASLYTEILQAAT
jgi:glycosyltransferase involved in cell wall biosynthesis